MDENQIEEDKGTLEDVANSFAELDERDAGFVLSIMAIVPVEDDQVQLTTTDMKDLLAQALMTGVVLAELEEGGILSMLLGEGEAEVRDPSQSHMLDEFGMSCDPEIDPRLGK